LCPNLPPSTISDQRAYMADVIRAHMSRSDVDRVESSVPRAAVMHALAKNNRDAGVVADAVCRPVASVGRVETRQL